MDGGPYGEPMTQSPIDLSRQGTHGCSAFFVPCGTFLIAHDSKCSRPISVVRCIVQGRSQEFVDVRNLVVGYVVGYLPTISEKTFGVVRTGSSEHEIDKHPLRFC